MLEAWAQDKRFKTMVLLVLVLAAIGIVAYTYLAYTQARFMWRSGSTISVTGKAEQFVKPDIATFTYSVMAEEKEATAAQNKSATISNAVKAYLKGNGVEDKDVKTISYYLNPKYEYENAVCDEFAYLRGGCPAGKQTLVGYTVEETVSVKVRNIEKVGELISGAGNAGATNVGSLLMTVDDPDKVKEEIRAAAIKDAKEQAKKLSGDLGVRLGRLVNFYEEGPVMPYDYGYGGALMEKSMDAAMVAPQVAPGEQEITASVSLIYEFR